MAGHIELRHLRYFVAVAKERNFGRAAITLGIAQPPLSAQIHDLERELGVELFDRRKRQIEITPAGAAYLVYAERMLALVDEGTEAARRAQRDDVESLSVGFFGSMTYGYDLLPNILARFAKKHPHVRTTLHEMRTDEQLVALRQGRLDLALALIPSKRDPNVIAIPLYTETLVAVLPPGHPALAQSSVELRQLEHEPFILLGANRSSDLFEKIQRLCQDAGFQPPIIHEVEQLATIDAFVANGFGVSVIPRLTAAPLQQAEYREVRDEGATVERGALRYADNRSQPAMDFIAELKDVIAEAERATHTGHICAR
jgi:DNA-binding transcriptional LysR family regulator